MGGDRRPVLLELRADGRLRGLDEDLFVSVHADADALLAVPQARTGRGRARQVAKSGFFYRIIDGSYGWFLRWALRLKPLVVLLTIGVILSTGPIAKVMGVALIPRDDQSEYEVSIIAPEGYTLDRTDRVMKEIEGRLRGLRGSEHVFTTVGEVIAGRNTKGEGDVTRGTIYVQMTDLTRRDYSQFDVQKQAREILLDYPDLRTSVNDVSSFGSGRRQQTFQVNMAGPDLMKLEGYANELKVRLGKLGGIRDLDTTLSLRKPEVQVAIDREAASDLGIPVGTISSTLRILVGGSAISKFKEGDEQYDVWLRARPSDRDSPADIYDIAPPLAESRPGEVSERGPGRRAARRADGDRAAGAAAGRHRPRQPRERPARHGHAADAGDPQGDGPPARLFPGLFGPGEDAGGDGLLRDGRAGPVVHLHVPDPRLLQFESWTQPIAILMSLPVTIPFGLLSLVMLRSPMDIYAMFGLFMLIGIVKKNGILQVDATNQLRAGGMPRHDAIVEANHTRLRPILMTTVMLVAAMKSTMRGCGQGPGRSGEGEHGEARDHRRAGQLSRSSWRCWSRRCSTRSSTRG